MKAPKAIAAMSLNRVIGQANTLPWRLPEDFKWFKQVTTGNVILMGRKTFESIGKPLPNRQTIILSKTGFSYPGTRTIRSLAELELEHVAQEVFICGGAALYEQTIPFCSELLLTLVKTSVEGDTFFPAFEHLFEPGELIRDTPEFSITRWINRSIAPWPPNS